MNPIYAAFREIVGMHGDRSALMARRNGAYVARTYRALAREVQAAAAALRRLGLEPGDRIGIFSYNRPEWAIADLAIHAIGGVVVPLYHTLRPDAVAYILRDSGVKLLFVENEDLLQRVLAVRNQASELRHIVRFEGGGDSSDPEGVSALSTFLGDDTGPREESGPEAEADSIATIIYTSGTTGEPKGVMLTHGNILSNVEALRDRYCLTPEDVSVSYLPLAHVFERTCGQYLLLLSGATIAYAQSVATVVQDIQEIRPTVLAAVPRAIEKAYDTAVRRVEEGSRFQRLLVQATVRCLNDYANRQYRGERIPLLLRGRCAVLNAVVASRFRKVAGDRLRLIVSAGAPLDRKLAKVLNVLGFKVLEGYGLTEASPTVTSMTLDDIALGTVGTPLPGVVVKIGEADEILVRGPNVMKGYFNKPDATARAIDADGFLHTGDRGRFDAEGHLVITGRIKDMIITSYGKNVAPAPIEADLMRQPLVEHVMLCGDNRKFLSALIVPDSSAVVRLANEVGLEAGPDDLAGVLEDARVRRHFVALIEETNSKLSNHQRIRRFSFLTEAPSVENGLLTPTLKLRRARMADRYATQIDDMYREQATAG